MRFFDVAAGAVALAWLCVPVQALTWSDGSTTLSGTTLAARPELAGQVIASQDFDVFYVNEYSDPNFQARVHNYVVREDGSGTLDFYFEFTNTRSTSEKVAQWNITGFDIQPVEAADVDQLLNGNDQPALNVAHFGDNDPLYFGSALRIGYFDLGAGETTAPIFIRTTATDFDSSGSLYFTSDAVGGLYAPVFGGTPVPEPMSLGLLSLGVLGLGLRVRVR